MPIDTLGVAISSVLLHASQTRFIEVLRKGMGQAAPISGRHVTLFGLTPRATKTARRYCLESCTARPAGGPSGSAAGPGRMRPRRCNSGPCRACPEY